MTFSYVEHHFWLWGGGTETCHCLNDPHLECVHNEAFILIYLLHLSSVQVL